MENTLIKEKQDLLKYTEKGTISDIFSTSTTDQLSFKTPGLLLASQSISWHRKASSEVSHCAPLSFARMQSSSIRAGLGLQGSNSCLRGIIQEKWSTEGIQPYTQFTALFIQKHQLQETNIHLGGTADTDTHRQLQNSARWRADISSEVQLCGSHWHPQWGFSAQLWHCKDTFSHTKIRPQRCHPSTKPNFSQVQLYPPCIIPFLWARWEFCH